MYKIAVIGDKDSALAFRALGVDVYTAYEKMRPEGRSTAWRMKDTASSIFLRNSRL